MASPRLLAAALLLSRALGVCGRRMTAAQDSEFPGRARAVTAFLAFWSRLTQTPSPTEERHGVQLEDAFAWEPPDRPRVTLPALRLDEIPDDWRLNVAGHLMPVAKGHHHEVYRGVLRGKGGREIAVKRFGPTTYADVLAAENEMELLKRFTGRPGFPTLYKAAGASDLEPGKYLYIMLDSACGSLKQLVVGKPYAEVGLTTRLLLFLDALRAVDALHKHGIVHRNLHSSNVLIFGQRSAPSSWSAALCGFANAGTSQGGPSEPLDGVVPAPFIPPEGWDEDSDDMPRDVWALGLLLYELLFGDLPVPLDILRALDGPPEAFKAFLEHSFAIQRDPSFRALRDSHLPMASVIARMLQRSPTARINAHEALDAFEDMVQNLGVEAAPRNATSTRT
eukprot:CAMPEP_0170217000 /NCGR_PEP_ID=MMETSP0116_2-20130129/8162_1 /TAXON_ID=400756 /ORGANISM="Durinskia baltica, Strain CSIRO CS-38" /LENGTH=393 /DNA_ID=CAMNT_0010467627 /DNA_START=35 /DNA_END=1212 /DNA_ORIENTATION=+